MSSKFVAAFGVFALVVASSGAAGAAMCKKSARCLCGSPTPSLFSFTTTVGSGTCGDLESATGTQLLTLDCSKLYIGGGGAGAVPPGTVPDYGTTKYKVCCRRHKLFLSAATATDTASCDTGSASTSIPLTSHVFLKGDMLPKRCGPGTPNPDDIGRRCAMDTDCGATAAAGSCVDDSAHIQPCPICNPGTLKCNGGPNDTPGMAAVACTPGTVASTGDAFPVSHDCPPAPPSEGPLLDLAIPVA